MIEAGRKPFIRMNTNQFCKLLPESVKSAKRPVEKLLLAEYGAVFIAQGVIPPPTIIFSDDAEVSRFQRRVEKRSAVLGDFDITLQANAMKALLAAATEASALDLNISPRGTGSAARTYGETVSLWASRVEPGLAHWLNEGRISSGDAHSIRALSPFEQVPEILGLESRGIYFAKDLSKSIIYSVAPPGASQHLSLLAFDAAEFDQPPVREILARHGWFQTVTSDLPHFTYLGTAESELPGLGLKKVENAGRYFWVPNF